jgi:hypothetical protein
VPFEEMMETLIYGLLSRAPIKPSHTISTKKTLFGKYPFPFSPAAAKQTSCVMYSTFNAFETSNFTFADPCNASQNPPKHEHPDKENFSPRKHVALESAGPTKKRGYTSRKTVQQKLETVFEAILKSNWTLSEFLYHAFCTLDESGNKIHRTTRHTSYVNHFLRGSGKFTPAQIIDMWFRAPDGRIARDSTDSELMFSTTTPYIEIKPARAALTAFAAQTVEKKLLQEVRKAVDVKSGLHATAKRKFGEKVEWSDIGAATVSRVAEILKLNQPLTWHYVTKISEGSSRKSNKNAGAEAVRNRRPVEMVRDLLSS